MKKVIILLVVISLSIIIYLLVVPAIIAAFTSLVPKPLRSLTEARDYYSTISSFVTVIVGLCGLVLGYFYYANKKQVDSDTRERERRLQSMELLMKELNEYDKLVHSILDRNLKNGLELKKMRMEISRTFDRIISMLEYGDRLLGLDETETRVIIRVNSFVEQSDVLMKGGMGALKAENTYALKDRYLELIRDARRTCFMRLC